MTVIRAATTSDAVEISALERQYIDCPWTLSQIQDEIQNDNALFFVAETDGKITGYLSGSCAADECEISNIAVDKLFRRQKIATRLFEALISSARDRAIRSVYLLVRHDNDPAVALYESLGFSAVGRRCGYYNGCDALIMSYRLT